MSTQSQSLTQLSDAELDEVTGGAINFSNVNIARVVQVSNQFTGISVLGVQASHQNVVVQQQIT
jgi:hypothetical protein